MGCSKKHKEEPETLIKTRQKPKENPDGEISEKPGKNLRKPGGINLRKPEWDKS